MRTMHLVDPVEILYLYFMLRWERSAPPDQHKGYLDGAEERNSQISRMAYIVKKIAVGAEERVFNLLAMHSSRADGRSYISKDSSWMKQPYPLWDGWFFEGCTSLKQKQDIIQSLTRLGLSPAFVACVDDFVEGRSVERFKPTEEDEEIVMQKVRDWKEKNKNWFEYEVI